MQADMASLSSDWQMVAISQDSPTLLTKTKKKLKHNATFLSDKDMAAAQAFGLSFNVDDKTVAVYKNYNIDLVGLYGRDKPQLSVPAVFLIGKDGTILYSYVNPDYSVRLDSNVLKAAAKAYYPK